jgi:hypothetical protein
MRNLRPSYAGARLFGGRVGDDGYRSGGDGLVDEFIAIAGFTPHGNKQVSRLHAPGVVLKVAHRGIPVPAEHLRPLQKLFKRH